MPLARIGDVPGISTASYQFLETDLRIDNSRAYHALAIDEHRSKFAPTLWTKPKSSTSATRTIDEVEQRWFVGAHANVGGGYLGDLLAQRPLQWIMSKAKLHGLVFRNDIEIDGDLFAAPITDSYADFMDGVYKYLPLSQRYFRPIDASPLVSGTSAEATTINETIDTSVFERWHKDPTYRPQNLADWAQRHNVNIDGLLNTVRADSPDTVVTEPGQERSVPELPKKTA